MGILKQISVFILLCLCLDVHSQIFLSEEWSKDVIGSPIYNWTVLTTDNMNNVYKAGQL